MVGIGRQNLAERGILSCIGETFLHGARKFSMLPCNKLTVHTVGTATSVCALAAS